VGRATATEVPPGVCPSDPAKPQLEPEALGLTDAVRAQTLATGKGVKVGFLADGVDVHNPEFTRGDGSSVFADYQDFGGDGPNAPTDAAEAFGDASAIAAQGRQSYDLSQFVNPASPLPAGCTIRVRGMAPDASLVGLKVETSDGFTNTSAIVQAIDYAVTVDKVDVLNESLGSNPYPDPHNDPFSLANQAAVRAGVTVTTAAATPVSPAPSAIRRAIRPCSVSARPPPCGCSPRRSGTCRGSRGSSATTSRRSAPAASPRAARWTTWSRRATTAGRCARRTRRGSPAA
jgi:hypothetical protein